MSITRQLLSHFTKLKTAPKFDAAPAAPSILANNNRIEWWPLVFPPYVLPESSGQRGIAQRMLDALIERLPEYKHTVTPMLLVRVLAALREGQSICSTPLLRSKEREQFCRFTSVSFFDLPNRLFVRSDRVGKVIVGVDRVVDIPASFGSGLRIGIQDQRTYGDVIDNLLANHASVERLPTQDLPYIMFRMGRVDAVVAHTHEVVYQLRNHPGEYRSFTLPGPTLIEVPLVACPLTPWGEAIASRIESLRTEDLSATIHSGFEEMLDPDSLEVYRRQMALLDRATRGGGTAAPGRAADDDNSSRVFGTQG